MSTVSNVFPPSREVSPLKVPAEFAHPALQELMRIGATHGSVDSGQLRDALLQAEISPKRMKVVLRSRRRPDGRQLLRWAAPRAGLSLTELERSTQSTPTTFRREAVAARGSVADAKASTRPLMGGGGARNDRSGEAFRSCASPL